MTRLQRLEKALRDDLSAMTEDFDSIMTNVDHSDLAWAVSQLHRLYNGVNEALDHNTADSDDYCHDVRNVFNDSNHEVD